MIFYIDYENNTAHADDGRIYAIHEYLDSDENPCLPEEAVEVVYYLGNGKYKNHKINDDYFS